jgi:hypothetical protein
MDITRRIWFTPLLCKCTSMAAASHTGLCVLGHAMCAAAKCPYRAGLLGAGSALSDAKMLLSNSVLHSEKSKRAFGE